MTEMAVDTAVLTERVRKPTRSFDGAVRLSGAAVATAFAVGTAVAVPLLGYALVQRRRDR